jgi:hypothetical protein
MKLTIILPKEVSDTPPLKGLRKFQEKTAIDHPLSIRSSLGGRRGKGISLLIQITIVFPADIRQMAERIDAGRDQPIENRNDLAPHTVPQVLRSEIAGVLSKRQPGRSKIYEDVLPLDVVQRPDNPILTERGHAGKTGQSCAAQHPEQDCFCLIVRRMAYGDSVRPALRSNLLQHTITKVTSLSL